jgi:hypothetical protein
MTFEDIKPGDTIWYQSHRQFDLLLSAKVISVDRSRKRSCIIKFYHETLKEELQAICTNSLEADNYVATSKEALKSHLIRRFKDEEEKTKRQIDAEIKKLIFHLGSIKNSIERIEKA